MKRQRKIQTLILFMIIHFGANAYSSELVVPFPKIAWQLNPNKVEDMYNYTIIRQLYRGLFRTTAEGKIEQDLVDSVEVSANKRHWVFGLKKAFFSNGEKITAKNVVDTFVRVFGLGASISADLSYIKNSSKKKMGSKGEFLGVVADGDDKVIFDLETPSALFTMHLATPDVGIVDINKNDDQPLAYSGPYKVTGSTETTLVIEKWREDSFDSKKPPKKIVFKQLDPIDVKSGIKGEIDTLDFVAVDPTSKKQLIEKSWLQSVTESAKTWFLVVNPALVKLDVRLNFLSRIDQSKVVQALGDERMAPLYGVIPGVLPGSLMATDASEIKSSVVKARARIKMSVELEYSKESPIAEKLANILQGELSDGNISVQLKGLSQSEYLKRMFQKKAALLLGSKALDYYDGFSELAYFRKNVPGNYFSVVSNSFDKNLDSAGADFDTISRAKRYKDLQKTILKGATFIPICAGSSASGLWSDKVKYVPPHPLGIHAIPFEAIEMKE